MSLLVLAGVGVQVLMSALDFMQIRTVTVPIVLSELPSELCMLDMLQPSVYLIGFLLIMLC